MHYATKLKDEVATLKEEARQQTLRLLELQSYLLSSKFHADTTVQVQDVLNRLWK